MLTIKQMLVELIDNGWTQREIARHVDISDGAISNILAGTAKDMLFTSGFKIWKLHRSEKRKWK